MSLLSIYSEDAEPIGECVEDPKLISSILAKHNILFEQYPIIHEFVESALTDYSNVINAKIQLFDFKAVDVASIKPYHFEFKQSLRDKFFQEHTHDDFEIRFFIEGEGLFYIHIDNKVFMILCKAGDLISVPAFTKHWFDMGAQPDFTCIRFFSHERGWIATNTGSNISQNFYKLSKFL